MNWLKELDKVISLQLPIGIVIGSIFTNIVWIITSRSDKNET